MRHTISSVPRLFLTTGLIAFACAATRAAGPEQDEYEKGRVERFADRVARVVNTDHARWLKTLQKAYPRRVTEPTRKEEYADWFELLSDGGETWRRVSAPNSEVAALFDRIVRDRKLGPVPAISRAEFMRYADRELDRGRRSALESVPEFGEEADRVFRTLDSNGDGILFPAEMTTGLRKSGLQGDADANGRIDKDEYRAYFQARVAADNEAALARAQARGDDDDDDDDDRRGSRATPPKKDGEEMKLPAWFAEADADDDGQIALFEWRKAGGAIDFFTEMDLNDDGLLTESEYWRYVKMKDKDDDWDDPPDDDPPPS